MLFVDWEGGDCMDKWEYQVVDLHHAESDKNKELLDKLGLDGWELVAVVQVTTGVLHTVGYLKRKTK
jgi:hypothetical protein